LNVEILNLTLFNYYLNVEIERIKGRKCKSKKYRRRNAGDIMDIAEPKCPECGGKEFTYKFIQSEENIRKGKEEQKIGRIMLRTPFAIAYCTECGHIIGFAGM
jgi:transposase-like protein